MKGKILTLFAAFFLLGITSLTSQAQRKVANDYPQGYFRNPLGIPYSLSANFGELRTNHWHMGLDMRTNQKENLAVYAAAGGFVSSIGIRPLSFGRFMIIEHPNGYSTLYAHLNRFFPELEKYVNEQQKLNESWAIELKFTRDQFPVRKGAFIGLSGNTGGSQGPHLHFEIRDTETGRSLNPLLFGFDIMDNIPPRITRLALYDRDVSTYLQDPKLYSLKKTGAFYTTTPSKIITGHPRISFAISAYDRVNGSSSNEGIYAAYVYMDDKLISSFKIDEIDYDESVYINSHIDYRLKSAKGISLQHLSSLPGDLGPVYQLNNGIGTINLQDTMEHSVLIKVTDAYNNVSDLKFKVQLRGSFDEKNINGQAVRERFVPGYLNIIENRDFEFYLQEDCIYDTVNRVYNWQDNVTANAISAQHRVNDPSIPVHCDFKVRILPNSNLDEYQKQKTVMVREWKGKKNVKKVEWQNGWAVATFSDFGNFQLFLDQEPPQINPPASGKDTLNLSPLKRIIFTPKDDHGIKSFRAELNGKWLKFSNDKGRSYIYVFDEQCPYGVHELSVRVEDLSGNVTERNWWFKRKPYTPPKPKRKTSSSKKRKRKR